MSFSKQLKQFEEKANKNYSDLVRGTKLKLFTAVVNDTPVDSGRLRGNWQASLDKPALHTIEGKRTDADVFKAIEANLGETEQTAYLTNNLPYAIPIEYGHSKGKAPAGMVRKNVARFQRLIQQELKKLRR